MKKFQLKNHSISEYYIEKCNAVAATAGDTEKQDALYVKCYSASGEIHESVVFNWNMPESNEEFLEMCKDHYSWDSSYETLQTVVKL